MCVPFKSFLILHLEKYIRIVQNGHIFASEFHLDSNLRAEKILADFLNCNLTAIHEKLTAKERENLNFFDPKFLVIAEIRVDHNSKSYLILTPSNDKKNFLIRKLGFLDTKDLKIEQIIDSNLVITRKSRLDTCLPT